MYDDQDVLKLNIHWSLHCGLHGCCFFLLLTWLPSLYLMWKNFIAIKVSGLMWNWLETPGHYLWWHPSLHLCTVGPKQKASNWFLCWCMTWLASTSVPVTWHNQNVSFIYAAALSSSNCAWSRQFSRTAGYFQAWECEARDQVCLSSSRRHPVAIPRVSCCLVEHRCRGFQPCYIPKVILGSCLCRYWLLI